MKRLHLIKSIPFISIVSVCLSCNKTKVYHPKVIFDYVCDLSTLEDFNENDGINSIKKQCDNWGKTAMCSCLIKTLPNGDTIAGRNYDFNISDRTTFVGKTKGGDNKYKMMFIEYSVADKQIFETVKNKGIEQDFYNMIPLSCSDVMNEKGLYIECHTRYSQENDKGEDEFAVSSTNPNSNIRLCALNLLEYVGSRAANVDEAISLVNSIDWYSAKNKFFSHNQSFSLADASGNFALLEFGKNSIYISRSDNISTNFYLCPEWRMISKYNSGLGRYEYLYNHQDSIQTELDMYNVMERIKFSRCYDYDTQKDFDIRTEFVQGKPQYTTEYVLDPKNDKEIKDYIYNDFYVPLHTLSDAEIRASLKFYKSIYTVVANCNKKTFKIVFDEDPNKYLEYSLD